MAMVRLHGADQKKAIDKKWPHGTYSATQWHPLLGSLTGKEEPLKHMKMFPEKVQNLETKFLLYDRFKHIKSPKLIHYKKEDEIKLLNDYQKLFVVIHGFIGSAEDELYQELVESLLQYKLYINPGVLVIDWSQGAQKRECYETSDLSLALHCVYDFGSKNVIMVGREVGLMVYLMVQNKKVSEDDVHFIGFNSGAQVAHFAGNWFTYLFRLKRKETQDINRMVARITALDPASLHFEDYLGAHVNQMDADFVDVIHTSSVRSGGNVSDLMDNLFGMRKASGSVDFYPNGGRFQPICREVNNVIMRRGCQQNSALIYFLDSMQEINREYLSSFPCNSWDKFEVCRRRNPENMLEMSSSMGIDSEHHCGSGEQFLVYSQVLRNASRQGYNRQLREDGNRRQNLYRSGVDSRAPPIAPTVPPTTDPELDERQVEYPPCCTSFTIPPEVVPSLNISDRDHPECGLFAKRPADWRIFEGQLAYPGQFPWQVAFYTTRPRLDGMRLNTFCGGSILDAGHILTAAHCWRNVDEGAVVWFGAGSVDAKDFQDTSLMLGNMFVKRKGITVFYPKKMNVCKNRLLHDLAIIKLRNARQFELPEKYEGGPINRLCWHTWVRYSQCDLLTLSGYGLIYGQATVFGAIRSRYLKTTSLNVCQDEFCAKFNRRAYKHRSDSGDEICVARSHPPRSRGCAGDSGSPHVKYVKFTSDHPKVENRRAVIVGVHKSGFPVCHSTVSAQAKFIIPNAVTRVKYHIKWITKIMNDELPSMCKACP